MKRGRGTCPFGREGSEGAKGSEGGGGRPSKRRGASLYKTFTTALADDRKAAPFGGWRHHLSPASGGTTTRDLLCATYEIIASRSFIVPPLQRGKGGAVGTKGGESHRRWLITVRQFLMMNLKVSAEMQPSRRLVFITVCLKCKEYRDSSLRMTMRAGRKSRNAGSFLRWQSCIGLPSRAKLALSLPIKGPSFCLPDRNGAAR